MSLIRKETVEHMNEHLPINLLFNFRDLLAQRTSWPQFIAFFPHKDAIAELWFCLKSWGKDTPLISQQPLSTSPGLEETSISSSTEILDF